MARPWDGVAGTTAGRRLEIPLSSEWPGRLVSWAYDDQMSFDSESTLAALLLAASGMWLGGVLTVPLLATTTSRLIAPAVRTEFFVVFGRRFAMLMGAVLALALLASGALVTIRSEPLTFGALALVVGLLVSTAVGIVQARRMSGLRRAAAGDGAGGEGSVSDRDLRRNAAVANALRSFIGLVSLALMVIAIVIAAGG